MFNQYPNNIRLPNKRINTLPSVAGETLRTYFASLKSCVQKVSRYAGCYISKGNVE